MKPVHTLALILGGFVLFAAFLFVRATPEGPSEPSFTHPPINGAPPAATMPSAQPMRTMRETPTADNVSHTFRLQVNTLERRVTDNPADTTALVELARLHQDAHQPQEALARYTQYLDLHPRNSQAWIDLATLYGSLQRWDDAAGAMDQMLARYPGHPAALYNLGAIRANQERFAEARDYWQQVQAQQKDPALAEKATASLTRIAHLIN